MASSEGKGTSKGLTSQTDYFQSVMQTNKAEYLSSLAGVERGGEHNFTSTRRVLVQKMLFMSTSAFSQRDIINIHTPM